jgi:4-amino-4-deoxy-L-arabinose transferase-like glycosyltransferase
MALPRTERELPPRQAAAEPIAGTAETSGVWTRWWWVAVAVVTGAGLAIRVASVFALAGRQKAWGDFLYYHDAANLLVHGIIGIDPIAYYTVPGHPHIPSASFPPLWSGVLALASLVGAKSVVAHRIWSCVIGAAAIPLGAAFGRQLVGRRVGLIVAVLIAVYPNLWMTNTLGLSESLTPILVLLVLMSTYRFWRRPSVGNACLIGASLGVAALGRDELALLVVLIFVPVVLLARLSWRQRLATLGAGLAVAGVLVGPWVGWNLVRFQKPVFISDGYGITLATATCNETWNGPFAGYWSMLCAAPYLRGVHGDEAATGAVLQARAETYIKHHLGSLPRVELEKVGRGFGFFHPMQQITLDEYLETRPVRWAHVGLWMYYGLAVLSVGGVVILRRRRTPVFPLLAVGATTVVTMVLTFGQTRYRTPFEVCLVVMAAVALDAIAGWVARRRRVHAGAGEPPI